MIGKLKGKLIELTGNVGLIETENGVSYEVYLTPQLLRSQHKLDTIEVYTYLQVKDDALVLFGFQTKKEHEFFKLLLTVSGVGPKTAFSVISFVSLDSLISCIKNNDVDLLTHVPNLGKKTAMKIILELSTKLKNEFEIKNIILNEEDKTVIEALKTLGYSSLETKKIVLKLPKGLTIEEKIKESLKKIKNE